MGQVNQPTNLLDRVIKLERGLEAIRKLAGLTSAIISRGGVTLLNDSFLKMISADGDTVFYVGPDGDGVQILEVRRDNGSLVLRTYTHIPNGQQYWALTDRTNAVLVSDDAAAGQGLARPWLPMPLTQMFISSGTVGDDYLYANLPVASLSGETTLWEGRGTISHPYIGLSGIFGQASGSNTCTYRLRINGTEVGNWATGASLINQSIGPFNCASHVGADWAGVAITAQAAGSGNIGCHVFGCYVRQSP